MSKISDLCNQLEKEYGQLMADVEAEKAKLAKDRQELTVKKKNLDEREEKIVASEAVLVKKEAEIEAKFSKIRKDEDVAREHEHTVQLEAKMVKEKKEIASMIAENNRLMDEIHLKQRELSDEKASYKEKIKSEIQDELKKLIK